MNAINLNQYLNTLICAICFCLGIVIKNSLDFIPNKYIPLIMAVIGIFINIWLNKWKVTPEIILEGIISGLSSSGTWELLKGTVLK